MVLRAARSLKKVSSQTLFRLSLQDVALCFHLVNLSSNALVGQVGSDLCCFFGAFRVDVVCDLNSLALLLRQVRTILQLKNFLA